MDYVAGLFAVSIVMGAAGFLILWAGFCSRLQNDWVAFPLLLLPIILPFFLLVSYVVGQQ